MPDRGKEEWTIKPVFTLRRRSDLSREEFRRYWRETHAPLVESKAEILKIRRYVQVHARENEVNPLLSGPRGSESDHYDGVAELWWDSLEEMKLAFTTEEGRAAGDELLEDERNFIDLCPTRRSGSARRTSLSSSGLLVVEEGRYSFVERRTPWIKTP